MFSEYVLRLIKLMNCCSCNNMEGTCVPCAEPTSYAHGFELIGVLFPCESLEHEGTARLWIALVPIKR